jgi:hypothetical protein
MLWDLWKCTSGIAGEGARPYSAEWCSDTTIDFGDGESCASCTTGAAACLPSEKCVTADWITGEYNLFGYIFTTTEEITPMQCKDVQTGFFVRPCNADAQCKNMKTRNGADEGANWICKENRCVAPTFKDTYTQFLKDMNIPQQYVLYAIGIIIGIWLLSMLFGRRR